MKKGMLGFAIVLSLCLLLGVSFVSASIISPPPCFVGGEIRELNFQDEYYEHNSTYGRDTIPCIPHDRLIPAQYIITINITEVSSFKEELKGGSESHCTDTYFKGEEKKFIIYANSMKTGDNLKVGNLIKGNVSSFLEETFFISNEYKLTEVNITISCAGCLFDEKCYQFGYRKDAKYCSDSKNFTEQLNADSSCQNNFECSSNVCVSGKCISEGFIQKLLDWFKKLFLI